MKRLVAAVALVYLAAALALPADAFYSGDGGVKVAQVRSLLASGFRTTALVDPFPALHPAGALFPFAPPFVHREGPRFMPAFAPTFPGLSAPFFAALGFRGLRVLPGLAALALLALVTRLARLVGFERRAALALAGFVALGTPVAFYAVQFWEHVPFTTVVVGAVGLALEATLDARRVRRALVGGALLGFGVALREEALVLLVAVTVALVAVRGPARAWTLGALAGVAAVLIGNLASTGHVFGFHALSNEAPFELLDGVAALIARAVTQLWWLLTPCPFYFLLALPLVGARRPAPVPERFLRIVVAISLPAIVVLTPNSGGTQWGARYLLPVVPLAAVLAAVAVRAGLARFGGVAARRLRLVTGVLVVWGLAASVLGGRSLARDLSEKHAMLDAVRALHPDAVITTNLWIAQTLGALWFEVPVLRPEGQTDLPAAFAALRAEGRARLIVVEGGPAPPGLPALALDAPALAGVHDATASVVDYRLESWRLER
jgi:hypothetical protein